MQVVNFRNVTLLGSKCTDESFTCSRTAWCNLLFTISFGCACIWHPDDTISVSLVLSRKTVFGATTCEKIGHCIAYTCHFR